MKGVWQWLKQARRIHSPECSHQATRGLLPEQHDGLVMVTLAHFFFSEEKSAVDFCLLSVAPPLYADAGNRASPKWGVALLAHSQCAKHELRRCFLSLCLFPRAQAWPKPPLCESRVRQQGQDLERVAYFNERVFELLPTRAHPSPIAHISWNSAA